MPPAYSPGLITPSIVWFEYVAVSTVFDCKSMILAGFVELSSHCANLIVSAPTVIVDGIVIVCEPLFKVIGVPVTAGVESTV
jgi:hypothetical protein